MLHIVLALAISPAQQPNVYFGNLHSHTSYSDGSGTPEDAYSKAKTAGLDFLAVTEHSHASAEGSGEPDPVPVHIARDNTLYNGTRTDSLMQTAARVNGAGGFVALYGQEFSSISKGNHVNVFEIGHVIHEADVPNGDFAKLKQWLAMPAHLDSAGQPALIQFNHPALHDNDANEYGRDDFGTKAAWLAAMGAHAGLIEILNGPALKTGTGLDPAEVMEPDYLTYLNHGFHLAPTGDQDNHFRTWGSITDARTAVVAPLLTRDAILAGLRARHVYATEDKNLKLIARVNGSLMGDRIGTFPSVGIELAITLSIEDADEPDASYRVDVFTDTQAGGSVAQIAETATLDGSGSLPISGVSFTGPGQYVFLKITQTNDEGERDRAWTAPVWFDGQATPTPDPTPTIALRLDSILPNPAGSDLDFEEATIRNNGAASIDLVGWKLRDLTGNTWSLDSLGTLSAGSSATIVRDGQAMSMNNSGNERIELVSPTSGVVDQITYSGAATGQVIQHATN